MTGIVKIILIVAISTISANVSAGAMHCRGDEYREYVQIGVAPGGYPLYEVYCRSYPNPSGGSSGNGGGISVPIIDMTLVKMLPHSIFDIQLF